MSHLTLEDILKDLEKSAGLNKQAEDDKSDDKENEKKEDKDSGAKDDKSEAKKDAEDAGKKAEDSGDKEEKEQTKEARLQGAALAQEVMSKVASLKIKTKDTDKEQGMKKEAAAAGKALADALLEKLASAGDQNTADGVAPGTVPQKNIVDAAAQVAEQASTIKPMPTGDGIKNDGTINQILEGIVADAIAQGATPHGQGVEAKAQGIVAAEGEVEDHAVPNQVDTDEQEKAAAVSALVADGFDFASAVEMVKAAAEEIEREEQVQIKQAALGALMDRGVEFDEAVKMIKEAGALVPAAGRALAPIAGAAKGMSLGKKVALAAGVGAAAGGAAAMAKRKSQEKQAALNALVESGVDFDAALDLVNAKADQIYGA